MAAAFPVLLALTFQAGFTPSTTLPGAPAGFSTTFPYVGSASRAEFGNDEAECYMDSSVGENPFRLQSNGVLVLVASVARKKNLCNEPYDSGMINTYGYFSQTYGYFEAELLMPGGQGLGSSGFWLIPTAGYSSELDVMENLGSSTTTIYSSVHGCTAEGGATCGYSSPSWMTNMNSLAVADVTARYHRYGVDWEPDTTTFYIDHKKTLSIPTPMSMNTPMYFILNLAVGGQWSWGGAPNAATVFPARMKIAAIRVYQTAGTTTVQGPGALVQK